MVSKTVAALSLAGLLIVSITLGGCNTTKVKQVNNSEYPTRPITMIVPYTAGGGPDSMARALEKVAIKYLGQPLIVSNIPGGGTTIGTNELCKAAPDGYTIGYVGVGTILQPLYGQTRYHYPTALDPLAQIVRAPVVAVVRADQSWANINDLVEYAKEHPGEIKFGHGGLGTGAHVTGELLAKEADINIVQVPFLGSSESMTALLGGHVQLVFSASPTEVKQFVQSGRIRVLAVAAENRLTEPEFKDVPTFIEQGHNVIFNSWYGIGASKELPKAEKDRLSEGLKGMINDPEFKKNMEGLGMTVEYLGPQEFSEKWNSETVRLTKIIQETGIADRIAAQKN